MRPGAAADPSDAELLRRTADGDRDAFAAIYRRHHGSIFRFARLMTGCDAMAEDVVQDVFVMLMRDARRYVPERALLSTYLYGVARRHTRRRLARERRFVGLNEDECRRHLEAPADADVSADVIRQAELRRLRRAIVSLPSRYREAVILCDVHDASYADAAGVLGCPVGTVRSRLHRGRQLLADKMRAAGALDVSREVRCAI